MLWHPKTLQNLAMYNVFFIFGRFSIAGKLPKWPKIPFQYPLGLRHPKILEKSRKHHHRLVSVRNRFWPPPPAKADIATAILTNVIEHLVLLLPPNKHAFTAKAVWADFVGKSAILAANCLTCVTDRDDMTPNLSEFIGNKWADKQSEMHAKIMLGPQTAWSDALRPCKTKCMQTVHTLDRQSILSYSTIPIADYYQNSIILGIASSNSGQCCGW